MAKRKRVTPLARKVWTERALFEQGTVRRAEITQRGNEAAFSRLARAWLRRLEKVTKEFRRYESDNNRKMGWTKVDRAEEYIKRAKEHKGYSEEWVKANRLKAREEVDAIRRLFVGSELSDIEDEGQPIQNRYSLDYYIEWKEAMAERIYNNPEVAWDANKDWNNFWAVYKRFEQDYESLFSLIYGGTDIAQRAIANQIFSTRNPGGTIEQQVDWLAQQEADRNSTDLEGFINADELSRKLESGELKSFSYTDWFNN